MRSSTSIMPCPPAASAVALRFHQGAQHLFFVHVVAGGAVDRIEFGVSLTRRALLTLDTPVPRGSTVTTEDGEFITLAQEGGVVFLPNVLETPTLWITAPGMDRCQLSFELPAKADTDAYYETAAAQCRAI